MRLMVALPWLVISAILTWLTLAGTLSASMNTARRRWFVFGRGMEGTGSLNEAQERNALPLPAAQRVFNTRQCVRAARMLSSRSPFGSERSFPQGPIMSVPCMAAPSLLFATKG